MFPNTLSSVSKRSLLRKDNLTKRIKMQLSQKQKTFSQFFSSFLKSYLNLESFQKKKKMTLIADVFPKLRTPKNIVISMPKKSSFRGSVKKQHGKCAKTFFKIEGHLLYHIYWSMRRQLCYKKPLLVICKILKLFPNTLSAYGKYSLLHKDNLTQRIKMQLSRKQKTVSQFFS